MEEIKLCKRGHELTPDNMNKSGRCKICIGIASQKWRLANAERVKQMRKAWHLANPEKYKEYYTKRTELIEGYKPRKLKAKKEAIAAPEVVVKEEPIKRRVFLRGIDCFRGSYPCDLLPGTTKADIPQCWQERCYVNNHLAIGYNPRDCRI